MMWDMLPAKMKEWGLQQGEVSTQTAFRKAGCALYHWQGRHNTPLNDVGYVLVLLR
jgi:hypothetical protein